MCAAVQSLVEKARSPDNGDILAQCMLSAQPEQSPKTEPLQLPGNRQLDEVGGSMQPIRYRGIPPHLSKTLSQGNQVLDVVPQVAC